MVADPPPEYVEPDEQPLYRRALEYARGQGFQFPHVFALGAVWFLRVLEEREPPPPP